MRKLGIRFVMITGDNPVTAAAIAAEAGIDDFMAQALPAFKLNAIRRYQKDGHMVAMIGTVRNDAPALAQADLAVAMNAGTQAAREAANMIDLDSNPAKLLDIVEIGKQLLMTRGALTTFSVANDVSKYFAISACHIRSLLSAVGGSEYHGPRHSHKCCVVGSHLQCPHNSCIDTSGDKRNQLPRSYNRIAASVQSRSLRSGRTDHTFHWNQAGGHPGSNAAPGVR